MPQYTAVNPSLVAFNPTTISDGMGDAFRLAQQYEQLKASKALQAELAATRSGRIGAEQAKNNALMQLTPEQTKIALAKLLAEGPNIAPRGALEGLTIGRDTGVVRGDIDRQPDELMAKALKANMDLKTAENEKLLLSDILNTRSSQVGAGLSDAMTKEWVANQMGLDQAKVQIGTVGDAAANLEGDLLTKRAMAEAQLDSEKAKAQNLREVGTGGIIPKGVTYDRKVESAAGGLNMTVEQVRALAGTRVGLSILGKINAAMKSTMGHFNPRFTKEEEAVLAGVGLGEVVAQRPVTPPAPPKAQQKQAQKGPVTIKSKAEYDKLPSGTSFVGPDGKSYVKP